MIASVALLEHRSHHALHEYGLVWTVGREYAVQDKDVLHVRF